MKDVPMRVFSRPAGRRMVVLVLAIAVMGLSACGLPRLDSQLQQSLLEQDDVELVRAGAPAYLLLIDSLIAGDPTEARWLIQGARLYSLYAAAFVEEGERARRLTARAFDYGQRALCARCRAGCGLAELSPADFATRLQALDAAEGDALLAFCQSWLAWCQAHKGDLRVLAVLPRLQQTLEYLVTLDTPAAGSEAWQYLGILHSLRPAALGGDPQRARCCFEQALCLGGTGDLTVKVAYARYYARLLYDRELHDRLLHEVLQADPRVAGRTLPNVLAQQQARQLLDSADGYF